MNLRHTRRAMHEALDLVLDALEADAREVDVAPAAPARKARATRPFKPVNPEAVTDADREYVRGRV